MRGEFEQIRKLWAPLAAAAPGAYDLRNDAAVVTPPADEELVVTLDTLIEGVHFLADDPPDLLARKALRVNLSDLAAMGAKGIGYLLSTAWSARIDDAWMESFAAGMAADQEEFAIHLLGGDTVRTPGPATFTITAVGSVPRSRALTRSGARAGDLLFVSGCIGDGALGLMSRRGELRYLSLQEQAYLEQAYRLPQPRLALGCALVELAHAALDISDGLLADVSHVAKESGLQATIRTAAVPLSAAAQSALAAEPELFETVLTGGDDYELAFALPAERAPEVEALAARLELPLTCIGHFSAGEGLHLQDRSGQPLELAGRGWVHF